MTSSPEPTQPTDESDETPVALESESRDGEPATAVPVASVAAPDGEPATAVASPDGEPAAAEPATAVVPPPARPDEGDDRARTTVLEAPPAHRHAAGHELSGGAGEDEARPAVVVEALGVRTPRHWVFRGVHAQLAPRSVAAVVGAAGSGRTSLLLTLAGRMRVTAGSVTLGERRIAAGTRGAALRGYRSRVAVALIGGHVGLDPELTLRHNVRDAADWARVDRHRALDHVEQWWERLDFSFDPHARVSELPALEQRAAHLVLATFGAPELVVIDDVTADLQVDDRRRIWEIAREVASSGPVVVAATLDELTLGADTVIRLSRDQPRHAAHPDQSDPPDGAHADQPQAAPDGGPQDPPPTRRQSIRETPEEPQP
ncbi:ATP-binding cassette domain-containing protein [Miniimonas arenae]|uniref:ATP-binding cassette domain-containing protein n=1 Tax=Miniimonas arenae TaxID=676201 RepID=A0A5C5BI73_9MICO|nr:ATP-binding cassette domain-containing protein [Miniimonas arenae]TNU77341.1 ATP-binding cassette domain-containing protein [Miniimonas arenae]